MINLNPSSNTTNIFFACFEREYLETEQRLHTNGEIELTNCRVFSTVEEMLQTAKIQGFTVKMVAFEIDRESLLNAVAWACGGAAIHKTCVKIIYTFSDKLLLMA